MNQVSKRALRALDDAGLNTYRIAAPGLRVVDGTVLVNHENPGITLRYTVDGRDPTDTSPRVERPIPLTHPVRVAAFDRRGRRGWIAEVQP
jgi:hexosaminidase